MKNSFFKKLIKAFVLLFAFCLISGIFLLVTKDNRNHDQNSKVEVSLKKDEFTFSVSSPVPGIILVSFGAVGLILMLIKIPVKQVITQVQSNDEKGLGFITEEKATQEFKLPLLIYWVCKSKRNLTASGTITIT